MKYFRHLTTGEVFAYHADGSQDAFIMPELVRMNSQEVQEHLSFPQATLTRNDVASLRRAAYADALNGSDSLFVEYQRMLASDSTPEKANAACKAWLDRAAEIATQYPWPE